MVAAIVRSPPRKCIPPAVVQIMIPSIAKPVAAVTMAVKREIAQMPDMRSGKTRSSDKMRSANDMSADEMMGYPEMSDTISSREMRSDARRGDVPGADEMPTAADMRGCKMLSAAAKVRTAAASMTATSSTPEMTAMRPSDR